MVALSWLDGMPHQPLARNRWFQAATALGAMTVIVLGIQLTMDSPPSLTSTSDEHINSEIDRLTQSEIVRHKYEAKVSPEYSHTPPTQTERGILPTLGGTSEPELLQLLKQLAGRGAEANALLLDIYAELVGDSTREKSRREIIKVLAKHRDRETAQQLILLALAMDVPENGGSDVALLASAKLSAFWGWGEHLEPQLVADIKERYFDNSEPATVTIALIAAARQSRFPDVNGDMLELAYTAKKEAVRDFVVGNLASQDMCGLLIEYAQYATWNAGEENRVGIVCMIIEDRLKESTFQGDVSKATIEAVSNIAGKQGIRPQTFRKAVDLLVHVHPQSLDVISKGELSSVCRQYLQRVRR